VVEQALAHTISNARFGKAHYMGLGPCHLICGRSVERTYQRGDLMREFPLRYLQIDAITDTSPGFFSLAISATDIFFATV
jgi:hypothetical protein